MTIQEHIDFKTACKYHILGVSLTGKARKVQLNISFDAQERISRDLKVPLYDVMMAVRNNYFNN